MKKGIRDLDSLFLELEEDAALTDCQCGAESRTAEPFSLGFSRYGFTSLFATNRWRDVLEANGF
jgi:hypothetical protein